MCIGCRASGASERTSPPPLGGFAPAGSSGASRLRPRLRRSPPASPRATPSAFGLTLQRAPKGGCPGPPTGQGATAPPVRAFGPPCSTPPEGASPLPTATRRFPSPTAGYQDGNSQISCRCETAFAFGGSEPSRWRPPYENRASRSPCVHRMPCLRHTQGRADRSRFRFSARHSHGGMGSLSDHRPRLAARASSSAAP